MVWPCFKVFWFSKDILTGHSERKKEEETDEEVGIQYQRVDRNFASSTRAAKNRTRWKGIVANSSVTMTFKGYGME